MRRGDGVTSDGAGQAGGGQPERRTSEPGPAEKVPCPRCGARAQVTPNPYFGTGLAVHRAVLLCAACGYAGLQDNEPSVVESTPPALPVGPVQRVLALIRHA
ncbi:hypothetical protein P5G50_02375 [Leifsonia sp. F6_8S_P_1B]|uniref:Zinc finger ZPR1-type domain-containing protein n=1 Tax=Leifsonia williamsii TaxID=3035919 RepID=A0ABT8K7Z8_9MICO|nr:hypothetical protein [Leifsonia williamsii]MDN4613287.1 hypothetical protein [Leifsonia williamsii]